MIMPNTKEEIKECSNLNDKYSSDSDSDTCKKDYQIKISNINKKLS